MITGSNDGSEGRAFNAWASSSTSFAVSEIKSIEMIRDSGMNSAVRSSSSLSSPDQGSELKIP